MNVWFSICYSLLQWIDILLQTYSLCFFGHKTYSLC